MRPGGPDGPGFGPGPGGPGFPPGFGPGPGGPWGPGPGGPGFWPGPGGPGFFPGFGGCVDGVCSMISSCLYCLCCCWLLQGCFGEPHGPPPF